LRTKPYSELLEKEFEQHPPQSINEASDRIEKLTGIAGRSLPAKMSWNENGD